MVVWNYGREKGRAMQPRMGLAPPGKTLGEPGPGQNFPSRCSDSVFPNSLSYSQLPNVLELIHNWNDKRTNSNVPRSSWERETNPSCYILHTKISRNFC